MTRLLVAFALLALTAATPACSDDCQRLADISCERLGEGTEECKRVRDQADRANADDKRACGLALQVADDFAGQQ